MLAKPSQDVYKQDILRFLIFFNKKTDEITKEEIKDYLYNYGKISKSKKKRISNNTRSKNKNAIVYFYKRVKKDSEYKLDLKFKKKKKIYPILF